VSSGSDLVIDVGGRSVVQRAMLVTHEMSYSPQHTVLRSRRSDIVLGAHAQKCCRFDIRTKERMLGGAHEEKQLKESNFIQHGTTVA
jgi:hypothetical protein